jgi:GxxExxY protein
MNKQHTHSNLIHEELSYEIKKILFDIYNRLGPQLPEKLYQRAVNRGLKEQGITYEQEKKFEVIYREKSAGTYYVDHWIENGKLLLELKVAPKIMPIHQAQTISYLKVSDADLGIIVNFGANSLETKRLPNFIRNKTVDFQWQPQPLTGDVLYPVLSQNILKALHRVHLTLGPGFIHRVYRQAIRIELQQQDIGYESIRRIQFYYKNYYLGEQKVQILKVENKILLGVFALEKVDEVMEVVMKARLKRFEIKLGLLANFYGRRLMLKWVLNT